MASSGKPLGRLWAGSIFGTNIGNIFAELEVVGEGITGTVRLLDRDYGPTHYAVQGEFDGSHLRLRGQVGQKPEDMIAGDIEIIGSLKPDGSLRGQWSSEVGTGGTFVLHPHDVASTAPAAPSASSTLPERLHTSVRTVGAVRLGQRDVHALIAEVSRDFENPTTIVTYEAMGEGNERSCYAHDFQDDMARLEELRYLKVVSREPEAYNLSRLASVELRANGANEVMAQGVQQSWVIGKAQAAAEHLKRHEKPLATSFRSAGLNVNTVIFVLMLIALPELPLLQRALFVGVVVGVLLAIAVAHRRFVPNAVISLGAPKPGFFRRITPQVISWLIAVSAAVVAAVAYAFLRHVGLSLGLGAGL